MSSPQSQREPVQVPILWCAEFHPLVIALCDISCRCSVAVPPLLLTVDGDEWGDGVGKGGEGRERGRGERERRMGEGYTFEYSPTS